MCEFVSWIEKGKQVYFLTRTQVDSPQGEALKKRFPGEGELLGHAAIRAYFELDGGTEREQADFSTPDNFPKAIVTAIKAGEFRGFDTPKYLLLEAKCIALDADYEAKRAPLDADYTNSFWNLFAIPENRNPAWV